MDSVRLIFETFMNFIEENIEILFRNSYYSEVEIEIPRKEKRYSFKFQSARFSIEYQVRNRKAGDISAVTRYVWHYAKGSTTWHTLNVYIDA